MKDMTLFQKCLFIPAAAAVMWVWGFVFVRMMLCTFGGWLHV